MVMAKVESVDSLRAAHDRLLDVLDLLDAAQEHGAAAHVIAAIDRLELRILPDDRFLRREPGDGAIAIIARQMVDRFGDRADSVARRQLDQATGSTFLAWAAIVSRIKG